MQHLGTACFAAVLACIIGVFLTAEADEPQPQQYIETGYHRGDR